MLWSELHYQTGFDLLLFSYKIRAGRAVHSVVRVEGGCDVVAVDHHPSKSRTTVHGQPSECWSCTVPRLVTVRCPRATPPWYRGTSLIRNCPPP